MNVIEIFFGLFFLIFILLSIGFSCKILLTYFDIPSLHLLMIIMCIDIWIFGTVLSLLEPLLPVVPDDAFLLVYRFGIITILLGMISFSQMMHRPIFSRITRFLSTLSEIVFSMIFALAMVDVLLLHPQFFSITRNSVGDWEFTLHPLTLTLLIVAISLIISAISLDLLTAPTISEKFIAHLKTIRLILLIGFTLVLCIGSIFFFGTIYFHWVPPKLGSIFFTLTIILLFSFLIYLSYTQPFFLFMSGIQPNNLFKPGYVGYLLGSLTDFGPEPILVSPKIKKRMDLSDEALITFTIFILSLTGTFDTIAEKVSLFPISAAEELFALTFTFLTKNPAIKDERMAEGAPTFFAVFIPSIMTLGLNNMPNILSIVMERMKEKEDLSQLAEHEFLKELTLFVLRKLLL